MQPCLFQNIVFASRLQFRETVF